jgi:spoIIIJ-associated protein
MSGVPANTGAAQEFSGKSVEEATAEGLRRLGLRAEDAEIEIVARGSRGLFGIGSEPAIVRIGRRTPAAGTAAGTAAPEPIAPSTPPAPTPATMPAPAEPKPIPAPPVVESPASQPATAPAAEDAPAPEAAEVPALGPSPERDAQVADMASDMLSTMVRLMGFDASVAAEWRDADAITDDRHLLLSVHGQNLSALIGRRGDTLENIQYLLRLMVNQKMHRWLNIVVDVEDYRAKRVDHLTHLALRMADQVAETGRSFALEPMPPNERRIVHLALRDHPQVFTESTGDADRRKVNIFPKK